MIGEKRRELSELLRSGGAKRRRDRWLVGAMVLLCVLSSGFVLVEAQRAGVLLVREPVTPPGPPAIAAIGAGSAERLEAADRGTQATPQPAPEESCDDLRVLVDRTHSLPPDYYPKDLVPLWVYRVPTLGGGEMLLRREAAKHLRLLVEDAAADGEELVVASAYRSYAHQRTSHARLASIYGSGAETMSATPGHSQHQLGTAVDFTNAAAGYEVWKPFGSTSASYWLLENASRHGFVLAYPSGQETETGYRWEPWHYRYVGLRHARRLEESGLSLQEFLSRENVLPRC